MLASLSTELLIILLLTLANGFFSGAEIAIVSARRGRLEQMAMSGRGGAHQAIALQEQPERFLATVQVGITLIGTFAAAFGGARIGDLLAAWLGSFPAIASYAETIALALVVGLITYLSLVLGELVPKRLALQHAERIASATAPIMSAVSSVARPIVALLTLSVDLVMRLLRQHQVSEAPVTQEDIVYLTREGLSEGTVEADEAQFIKRVFQFTDRPIRTVMTPRTEVTALDVDASWEEVISAFLQSGYSRIPVYRDNLDHVVGILHVKDILPVLAHERERASVMTLLRPPTFVLDTQHIDDILTMFRRQGTHLGVVIDEYGQVAGLITIEDLLEELVGEILDEYDHAEEPPFVQREDGSWLVDGMQAYDKVQEHIGLPVLSKSEHKGFTTLAGLMIDRLNRLPQLSDTVRLGDYILEVVDLDGHRIDKVLIRRNQDGADEKPTSGSE